MNEVEGFEETLTELRIRPGLWRTMATVDDEHTAILLRDAIRQAERERMKPQDAFAFECREAAAGQFSVYGRYVPDETDELNPHAPPTSGLATRRFRGTDPAEMLRRVAEYLDRANPGRMIVGLWCVPPSDGSDEGMEFDVVIEHDEDAYEYYPDDE